MITKNLHFSAVIPAVLIGLFLVAPVHANPEQIQQLIADGKLDQALAQTNKELAADKENVSYRFLKGLILTRQEKYAPARDIFIGITRTNPELPEPYNNLAVIYAALGDFDKARQALEQAIHTHPAYATAYENIGDIYARLASQAYNQALELDRDNSTAKAKLSLVNNLASLPQPVIAPSAAVAVEKAPAPVAKSVAVVPPPAPAPPAPQPAPVKEVETSPVQVAKVENPPVTVAVKQKPVEVRTPPESAVVPPEQQSPVMEVKQMVIDWANAWSAQNLNRYLSFYATDFMPQDGRPIEQWRLLREKRLSDPGKIQVTVADLVVEMTGASGATATFTQGYQSDNYSDRVKKTLVLKLQNNRWVIAREQT